MRSLKTLLVVGVAQGILSALLAGCGGGAGSAPAGVPSEPAPTTGRVTFTIFWPDAGTPARVVPRDVTHLELVLRSAATQPDAGRLIARRVVARPNSDQSTETFTNLPAIDIDVEVIAYRGNPDVPGEAARLATGTARISVPPGGSAAPVPLSLTSAVATLEATPVTLSVGQAPVRLTATAKDLQGRIVPVRQSLRWTYEDKVRDERYLRLTPEGDAQALEPSPNPIPVIVTEVDSNISLRTTVRTVSALTIISTDPLKTFPLTVPQGQVEQLQAVIKDVAGNNVPVAVTWSVTDAAGAAVSAIDPQGRFTAPLQAGQYTVRATDVQGNTATATIIVPQIAIALEPLVATVEQGGSRPLRVTVTGAASPAVDWEISPNPASTPGFVSGSFTVGASGTDATFVAPFTNADPIAKPGGDTFTITARSRSNSAATATATITVPPLNIVIRPAPVGGGPYTLQSQQTTFTATVTGAVDKNVDWHLFILAGGTIGREAPEFLRGPTTNVTQVVLDAGSGAARQDFLLRAISRADGRRQADLTLNVRTGEIIGTIR
jgi:hypothetical protein